MPPKLTQKQSTFAQNTNIYSLVTHYSVRRHSDVNETQWFTLPTDNM